jgi:HlyD family secretion protein
MRPIHLIVTGLAAPLLVACDNPNNLNIVVGELASDRIELIAEVNEPILEILVAEGEAVSAGQLLLRQDDTRAQITQARANLEGASRDIEFRRTEFQRAKDLLEKELASPQARDRARAELDAFRKAQLEELLAGTTVEELAQAEQALQQAQARRDNATVDVERHRLVAPVDGLFDTRLFEPGERPPAGQPVAVMLGGSQPYARIYVPERLRARVRPGTDARIAVDGIDASIGGRVRWVAHEAAFTPYFALTERDRGRLTYLAKVDIEAQQERLPDGVPVEVELLLPDDGQ